MALEPIYTLDVACELIPITRAALHHILMRRASEFGPPLYHHSGEARYRNGHLVDYDGGHAKRMLTESDCLKVREMITKTGWATPVIKPAYGSNGGRHAGGRGRHPAKIIDLLMAEDIENVS